MGRHALKVGVSSCLVGERVRWNGGHKRDAVVAEALASEVELVAVCPEVEIGLGTPREPIEIRASGDSVRLVGVESGRDLTEAMRAYARRRIDELVRLGISGYVLKARSPSCDVENGLFAAELRARLPTLPIEDESRLQDPRVRKSFLERALAYSRSK